MRPQKNVRTYSREDRSISLAPLSFDEAVADLLSVPAPPKEPKAQAETKNKSLKRALPKNR